MKFEWKKTALLCAMLVGVSAICVAYWPNEPVFERLKVEIVKEYPHDSKAFTQGLEFHDGVLWEGTGRYGTSTLRKVKLDDGVVQASTSLPREHFGEGITKVGDTLLQLTWKAGTAYRWKASDLSALQPLSYSGEGWGLCYNGKQLVMSNGTDRLSLRDPKTMKEVGYLRVRMQGERLAKKLNELECVGERIYANAWREDLVYRIEAATGDVSAVIDARALRPKVARAEVLNGIAYLADREHFLLTGKFWPVLYEVRFVAE